MALAVLNKTLSALRALHIGIESQRSPLLTCRKIAAGAQEAFVLICLVHKAGGALVVGCHSACINTVHARLEAIVRTKSFATMASVTVKVLMLLVADHGAELDRC